MLQWKWLSFQINKNYRKQINQIQFDFNYILTQENIGFDNLKIDKKKSSNIDKFIDDFNFNAKLLNRITFKNFVNKFFTAYFG